MLVEIKDATIFMHFYDYFLKPEASSLQLEAY